MTGMHQDIASMGQTSAVSELVDISLDACVVKLGLVPYTGVESALLADLKIIGSGEQTQLWRVSAVVLLLPIHPWQF